MYVYMDNILCIYIYIYTVYSNIMYNDSRMFLPYTNAWKVFPDLPVAGRLSVKSEGVQLALALSSALWGLQFVEFRRSLGSLGTWEWPPKRSKQLSLMYPLVN